MKTFYIMIIKSVGEKNYICLCRKEVKLKIHNPLDQEIMLLLILFIRTHNLIIIIKA